MSDVVLNRYGIYYETHISSQYRNMNSLQDMIRYDELVDDKEVVQIQNRIPIISKISNIEMQNINDDDQIGSLNNYYACFDIDDQNQNQIWTVCDVSTPDRISGNILEFRNQLITKVIQNVELKNEIRYVNGIVVLEDQNVRNDMRDDLSDWNYMD